MSEGYSLSIIHLLCPKLSPTVGRPGRGARPEWRTYITRTPVGYDWIVNYMNQVWDPTFFSFIVRNGTHPLRRLLRPLHRSTRYILPPSRSSESGNNRNHTLVTRKPSWRLSDDGHSVHTGDPEVISFHITVTCNEVLHLFLSREGVLSCRESVSSRVH